VQITNSSFSQMKKISRTCFLFSFLLNYPDFLSLGLFIFLLKLYHFPQKSQVVFEENLKIYKKEKGYL